MLTVSWLLASFVTVLCSLPGQMERYPVGNLWDFEVELFNFINETSRICLDGLTESSAKFKYRISDTQAYYFCLSNLPWFHGVDQSDPPEDYTETNLMTRLYKLFTCTDLPTCFGFDKDYYRFRLKRQATVPALRKEYRMLSNEERGRLHAAINTLKRGTRVPISMNTLISFHLPNRSPGAHFGAAFLPWHREYLRVFETALRQIDPSVALPYWDSTLDEGLPNPADSVLWTPELLGNGNGAVTSGPFANWRTTDNAPLMRNVGRGGAGSLYRPLDIDYILRRSNYGQLTACIDPYFESIHGAVHVWVGGHMANIQLSPNDPIFWMHHTFVDYLWEEFRQKKQSPTNRETDYPPPNAVCSPPHEAEAQMLPFSIKNREGLSNKYTQVFYRYQPRPACSSANTSCGSPYLFCDIRRYRCLSKVMKGGDCGGYEGLGVCYQSQCVNRKCV